MDNKLALLLVLLVGVAVAARIGVAAAKYESAHLQRWVPRVLGVGAALLFGAVLLQDAHFATVACTTAVPSLIGLGLVALAALSRWRLLARRYPLRRTWDAGVRFDGQRVATRDVDECIAAVSVGVDGLLLEVPEAASVCVPWTALVALTRPEPGHALLDLCDDERLSITGPSADAICALDAARRHGYRDSSN
jgi:hypothetical protein